MLVVKVEWWPHGIESEKFTISEMKIFNNGTNPDAPTLGNYNVMLDDNTAFEAVRDHPRNSNVWYLIKKCLNSFTTLPTYLKGDIKKLKNES